MRKLDNRGFEVGSIALVLIVLAVIGLAGWMVYQQQQNKEPASSPTPVQSESINSTSDLDKAGGELDAATVDKDLDTSEVEQDLDAVL